MRARYGLLAIAIVSPLAAQVSVPQSAAIEWVNFRVIISPDSSGTYVWTLSDPPGAKPRMFSTFFAPSSVASWTADSRAFLTATLADGDTGTTRASTQMNSATSAARVYLARRKVQGAWTNERFISFEPGKGKEPVLISGTVSSIGEILDSLEAVGRRTSVSAAALERAIAEEAKGLPETPPRSKPGNRPPRYPIAERQADREGMVLMRFVVTPEGKADMASAVVVHTSSRAFLESVLDAMPRFRFDPARRGGVAVREEVVMPFSFSLKR